MFGFQNLEPCTVIAYKMVRKNGKKTYEEVDVFIDEEDAEWVCRFRWRINSDGYVVRGHRSKKGNYYLKRLHREVMKWHGLLKDKDVHDNMQVDHKNHDKLDNRKCNLRVCTPAENKRNRRSKNGSYKGIQKTNRGYKVTVTAEGKGIYIGTFPNMKIAKHFYNKAGKQLHGEFFNPTLGDHDND